MNKKITIMAIVLLIIVNFRSSHSEEDPIVLADLFLDMLEYEKAIYYYNQAIIKNPNRKGIREGLGYTYFELGKYDESLNYLEQEIRLFPQNYDAYLLLGYVYFKINKINEAAESFESYNNYIRKILPKRPTTRTIRGEKVKINEGKIYSEEAIFEQIKKKNPNLGLPSFVLAIYHKKKREFSEAETNFKQALERGYNPVQCYLQMIDIELTKEKWKDATKKVEKSLKDIGFHPEFYFIAGYAHAKRGNIQNAIYYLKEAIQQKPYFREAMKNLAVVYYNEKAFDKAVEILKRILEMKSHDPEAEQYLKFASMKAGISIEDAGKCPDRLELTKEIIDKPEVEYKHTLKNELQFVIKKINSIALELIKTGQFDEAIRKLHNGLKINEKSPEMNYNLGLIYNKVGELDRALEYGLKAAEYKEDFRDAHDSIGNTYFKMKEYEKSLEAYKKVIDIDPKDAMGYYNIGCVYYDMKNYEEAENSWKNAIKFDKRSKVRSEELIKESTSGEYIHVQVDVLKRTVSFYSYKSLGSLYAEKGKIGEAIESYRNAMKRFPRDADCYYELGNLYIKEEDKQNAIKYLKKYLEYGTEKEKEVKELLKELKENIL